ncbi:hypothetical protein [Streptomyces lincolnensis]|uniref:hypothetical protein n=1 Tax=Streptomyces lincolnensis TaxID=1915 RepID=UPI0037D1FB7B
MPFTVDDTVRAQTHRVLAASTRRLTASTIADLIGTTPAQTGRALRQLEAQGLAIRDRGPGPRRGGRAPHRWRPGSPD